MNILLVSSDDSAVQEITALCSRSVGTFHRLRVVKEGLEQLGTHLAAARNLELLIIHRSAFSEDDLGRIEAALESVSGLNCLLISPEMSSSTLMRAMRAGVRYVLPTPLEESSFQEQLTLIAGKVQSGGQQAGRVTSFISCQGGSGTTFLAANLAYTEAAGGQKKILLIDLDQRFGNANLYLAENKPGATLVSLCAQVERLDSALLDASVVRIHDNLDLIAGAGDPAAASEINAEQFEQLLSLARQRYDLILLDLGQDIDPLSIVALDQSERICLVLQSSLAHLFGGKRLVDILQSLGYSSSQFQVLMNQYDAKRAPITLDTFKEKLGISTVHVLPGDEKFVSQAVAKASPLQVVAANSPLSKGLSQLTAEWWPREDVPVAKRSLLKLLKSK
jgi:pilus assembly protein CpaE